MSTELRPCTCGHAIEEHDEERGACNAGHDDDSAGAPDACMCLTYDPDTDEQP